MIMSADYERQLLARARELADISDLAETVLAILGGARNAGLDPGALGGLVGAANALGASGISIYAAGTGTSGPHADETQFLSHVSDAEDDIADRLKAAQRLREQVLAALDAALDALEDARRALAAAHAMPTKGKCDGCHNAKAAAIAAAEAAIADAEQRISLCETAIGVLDPLIHRLRHALARLRAVPSDLGETYESVYNLIRRGGVMPYEGRWVTGQGKASA